MESTSLHSQDTARCLWGPQHPGGWNESLSNRAGLCGEGGGRRGGRRWSAPLGAAGGAEVSIHLKRHTYLEGPVGSGRVWGLEDQRGTWLTSPQQLGLGDLLRPCTWSSTFQGPLCSQRRKRQAGWGGTLREQISEVTGIPPSIEPRAACGGPKPDTPRTEAVFCFCYWGSVLPSSCFIYIFSNVNLLNLFGILCYCYLLLFLPHCTTCRILVLRPEVRPEFLYWECQVQTPGLTENISTQGLLIKVRSPGGPRLTLRPSSTQSPAIPSARNFRPNNQKTGIYQKKTKMT